MNTESHYKKIPGRFLFSLILLMIFAQVAASQNWWQRFTSPDGDFTVEFPTPPQHSSMPNKQEGSPIEIYSAIAGRYSYGVVYQDAPQPVDEMSRASLKALADGCKLSVQSSGRKLLRVRQLHGGVIECLSTGPSGNYLYPTDTRLERNFVRGARYYTLSVISWAEGGIDKTSSARFFSSFRLAQSSTPTAAAGNRVQQILPPLVPRYENDPSSGVTRVSLPLSLVEGSRGASFVEFSARYAYDKEWRDIGTMNEVMLFFGMSAKSPICQGKCLLTMIIDGERSSRNVQVQTKPTPDGGLSQSVSIWLTPQSFRKVAAARTVDVQIASVSFRLTERQMEGLRKMIPFLKERVFQ
jgi:hypothetical protein